MRNYIKTMIYGAAAVLLLKPYIAVCAWLYICFGGYV